MLRALLDYQEKAGEVRKNVKNKFVSFRDELWGLLKKRVKKRGK